MRGIWNPPKRMERIQLTFDETHRHQIRCRVLGASIDGLFDHRLLQIFPSYLPTTSGSRLEATAAEGRCTDRLWVLSLPGHLHRRS